MASDLFLLSFSWRDQMPSPSAEANVARSAEEQLRKPSHVAMKPDKRRSLAETSALKASRPPTVESFGVSAQIGSGVVRGGSEVRFHKGSTGVPPGVPPGFSRSSARAAGWCGQKEPLLESGCSLTSKNANELVPLTSAVCCMFVAPKKV